MNEFALNRILLEFFFITLLLFYSILFHFIFQKYLLKNNFLSVLSVLSFWREALSQSMEGIFKRSLSCCVPFEALIHSYPHSAEEEQLIILDFQFLLQLTGFRICFMLSYNVDYPHRNCTIVMSIQCKCPCVPD